jgi:oxygen-dependent protoporphyrinogen oxidase
MKRVVILGAGIVGLSLAYYLRKYGPSTLQIEVFDKNSRVGGMIFTEEVEGALFELGPHTLRLAHPYRYTFESLLKDLKLEQEIIYPSSHHKIRYVASKYTLNPLLKSPLDLFKPEHFFKITYPLLSETFKKKSLSEDLSLYDFMTERFTPYIRDYLVNPLVSGIFGGDLKELSLKACFPNLDQMRRKKGPLCFHLLKHKKEHPTQILSFKRGMKTLPERLYKKTKAHFFLNSQVRSIELAQKPRLTLDQRTLECDHLFSSLPAHQLYALLKEERIRSSFLPELKFVSYKVIHLGFKKKLDLPMGFGFLTTPIENPNLTGVLFDSNLFEAHNSKSLQTRLTLMVSDRSPLYDIDFPKLIPLLTEDLSKYLKSEAQADYQKGYEIKQALPLYEVHHETKLKELQEELREKTASFTVLGSSFYGASIPACIEQGKQAAANFLKTSTLKIENYF